MGLVVRADCRGSAARNRVIWSGRIARMRPGDRVGSVPVDAVDVLLDERCDVPMREALVVPLVHVPPTPCRRASCDGRQGGLAPCGVRAFVRFARVRRGREQRVQGMGADPVGS